jgi:hypothetical protein
MALFPGCKRQVSYFSSPRLAVTRFPCLFSQTSCDKAPKSFLSGWQGINLHVSSLGWKKKGSHVCSERAVASLPCIITVTCSGKVPISLLPSWPNYQLSPPCLARTKFPCLFSQAGMDEVPMYLLPRLSGSSQVPMYFILGPQ